MWNALIRSACLWLSFAALAPSLAAAEIAPAVPPALLTQIDQAARKVLADTGVPGASVAIVRGGELAMVRAYGDARLAPRQPADPGLRYHIGSVSKQFTATAMLLLVDRGALRLDDPVARFLPDLTRSREVTIRHLLSHTSGYQDYWPQDYVPPNMLRDVSSEEILERWARRKLDFDPGTRWQYSNTNFVIAGLIIEKASGVPFWTFLRTQILVPLGLDRVVSIEQPAAQGATPAATGYQRYGLGPLRPAPREGRGWLFATAELSMTAGELARWDLALLGGRLLSPAARAQLSGEVLLKNGVSTGYALGIGVKAEDERRVLGHGGEVSGFCAVNQIFPDDGAAIVVLVNQDRTRAAVEIADKIRPLLFSAEDGAAAAEERARRVFLSLRQGKIDRGLFSDNANGYFTEEAVRDFAAGLRPLGALVSFKQTARRTRGGMVYRRYKVKLQGRTISAWTRELPDGKLEEYQIAAEE